MPRHSTKSGLTQKEERFIAEYLIDGNATRSVEAAGYSTKWPQKMGSDMLKKQHIQAALEAAQKKIAKKLDIKAEQVLQDLWTIAQADARELIELRRTCCRYCWGENFRYQRTEGEMEQAREAWAAMAPKQRAAAGGNFNEKGGTGYNAKLDPNEHCPECFGDGVENVHAKDSRKLSAAAARLYAGVKQTKDGLEIKMHDQKAALIDVGKHLGMFRDRLEHSGPNGEPLPTAQVVPVFNITVAKGKG